MRRCAAGQGLGQGSGFGFRVNPSCAALRSGTRSSQQGLAASSRMRTQMQFVVAQQLPIYVPPCSTASRCTALILFGFPRAVNSTKCKSPNLSKHANCCHWQRALSLICVFWTIKYNPKRHELFPPSFDSPQTAATAWQAASCWHSSAMPAAVAVATRAAGTASQRRLWLSTVLHSAHTITA